MRNLKNEKNENKYKSVLYYLEDRARKWRCWREKSGGARGVNAA